ncbi:T9SS type A sorting domain-containing protein [Flavobacteriaceae bacterium M23B6Z8]
MKSQLLIPLLLLISVFTYGQDKLAFSYDQAGNQILRDRICLNCSSTIANSSKDSIPVNIREMSSEQSITEKFIAAPNPVTHILNVEWIGKLRNPVKQITLFNSQNKLISTTQVAMTMNQLQLNFERYPSGFYLLLVTYANGTKETYKIIKK